MDMSKLSDEELRKIAGLDSSTKDVWKERIAIKPEDFTKFQKIMFGEIKRHEKPKEGASLRERLEIKPEDVDLAVRNVATALPVAAIKGAAQLAKAAANVPGNVSAKIKSIRDNSLISRLQRNPTLKKKVIEDLSKEAGAQKFSSVPNEEAGKLAIKSAENYKNKADTSFGNIFQRSKSHLDKHIAGRNNPNRLINPDSAIDFGIKKLASLESPTLQKEWLLTGPGQEFKQLLKIRAEKGGIHVNEAEHIRRSIGNKTSKAGAMGNLEQGELRQISGLLKGEIGQKYKEAGPQAHRHWERSHKHYTLHKKNNAPKTNETLKSAHEPESAFSHSIKDIKSGASNLKHTSQYLKGPEKQAYHQGIVFELGKKADKWDAATFHKNFAELPAKNKRLVLDKMSPEDRKNIWALRKRLKTINLHEGKKSTAEIGQEFLPHWAKRLVTEPIKTVRHNTYIKPEHVTKVTEALKRKAHPTKAVGERATFDMKTLPGLAGIVRKSSHNDLSHLSDEELFKMAGLDRSHHAKGDVVNPGTVDPYDSDQSDPDSGPDEDYAIVGHKNYGRFAMNHIMTDRGTPLQRRIVERGNRRAREENVPSNTVMTMTPKWRNRLFREFKKPEFQRELLNNQNAETKRPIKMGVHQTELRPGYPPYVEKERMPALVSVGKKHPWDFTYPYRATRDTPIKINHLDHVRPKF